MKAQAATEYLSSICPSKSQRNGSGSRQDAAIKAVRGALETADREKVRVLTAVLAGAGTSDRPADLDFEAVLSILADLSPVTLRLGRDLYDQVMTERLGIIEGAAPAEGFPDADFHAQRLEAAGLINRLQAQAVLGASNLPARWMPTSTFRRIMGMVRQEGAPTEESISP